MRQLLLILALTTTLHAETLATILTAHNIPTQFLIPDTLQTPIPAFTVSKDNTAPFVLAYRLTDIVTGDLSDDLHLLRYDRSTNSLLQATLQNLDSPCIESDLVDIAEQDGFITIDTHINPSAGCLLVINTNLTLNNQIYGFSLARIAGSILYQESEPHFTLTHPAEVSLFDPRIKHTTKIYPLPTDPDRQQFSAKLRAHLPSAQSCQNGTNTCEPGDFTTDITAVTVSPTVDSFTFRATMTADGHGDDATKFVPDTTIEYTFKRTPTTWSQTSQQPIPTPP